MEYTYLGLNQVHAAFGPLRDQSKAKAHRFGKDFQGSHILLYLIWAEARNPNSELNILAAMAC